MGFDEALAVCYKKYFGFGGRAGRAEFWSFFLFAGLAVAVTIGVDYTGRGIWQPLWVDAHMVGGPAFDSKVLVSFLAELATLPAQALALLSFCLMLHLVALSAVIPFLAVMTRRFHDTGRPAWWTLLLCLGAAQELGGASISVLGYHPPEPGSKLAGMALLLLGLVYLLQRGVRSYNKYDFDVKFAGRPAKPPAAPDATRQG